MAVVFLTITPIGTATPSVSRFVAGVHRILRRSGLVHELTAMGTIIEGDLDAILAVVREMHEAPFGEGAVRVSTLLKIDDRRDKEHSIARKMRSVRAKLAVPEAAADVPAPTRRRTRRTTARRGRR